MAALTTQDLITEYSSAANMLTFLDPQVVKSLSTAVDALIDPTVVDPSAAYQLS